MSLLSRFFYKRPPDGLLEFVERVYGNGLHSLILNCYYSFSLCEFCVHTRAIIAYPLFGFMNMCSFWFVFFNRSLAWWNVPNLLTWNYNWVTWGIPRLIVSCVQFPRGWETEPLCGNSMRIWCYRFGLSTTVWGLPFASIIFDSTFSSCLWELAFTWESTEYYSSSLWEGGLATLGIPFS